MINLYPTTIDTLSIHKVGNQSKSEGVFMSKAPYSLNDETNGILKEYFFKPFREKEENYLRFDNDIDLEFNVLYQICQRIFSNPEELHTASEEIARHLYDQSNHPHIKAGEVYVAYLTDVMLDNQRIDAIGIFKSEIKRDYFEVTENGSELELSLKQGISPEKLDKGLLVLNTEAENGYKLLSVDSNRYDTRYWLEDFIGADDCLDETYFTKKYLKFCQDFAKDVVLPAEDKKEEVMFMNKAMNHFAKNDEFEETAFLNEVMDNPDLIPEFKHYKVEQGPKYSIEDISSFSIANEAVSDARKKFKSVINLDTNVQIKMNFINSESAEKFIEKGWDEERQMYYYLVYFNKEEK